MASHKQQQDWQELDLFHDHEPEITLAESPAASTEACTESIQQDAVADETLDATDELELTEIDGQTSFIDFDEWWKVEWQGMPEFVQNDLLPWKSMYIHFRSREDMQEFAQLVNQRLTADTPSIYFPEKPRERRVHMGYVDES